MTALYDRIGEGYDETRRPDPSIVATLIRLFGPQTGCLYLDIGCGSGNHSGEILKRGFDVVGVDASFHRIGCAIPLMASMSLSFRSPCAASPLSRAPT